MVLLIRTYHYQRCIGISIGCLILVITHKVHAIPYWPCCPLLSMLSPIGHAVLYCPYCRLLSMLSPIVHVVAFCPCRVLLGPGDVFIRGGGDVKSFYHVLPNFTVFYQVGLLPPKWKKRSKHFKQRGSTYFNTFEHKKIRIPY